MTPEEYAKIEHQEEELIKRWSGQLSKDELPAWLEARADDMGAKAQATEIEIAGLEALVWMMKHYQAPPRAAIRTARDKSTKTLEEAEALDAWNRYVRQNST
jgi:hypothetical protein